VPVIDHWWQTETEMADRAIASASSHAAASTDSFTRRGEGMGCEGACEAEAVGLGQRDEPGPKSARWPIKLPLPPGDVPDPVGNSRTNALSIHISRTSRPFY